MERKDSDDFVTHEPCPKCGSSDALARYADGHAHCFAHGCDYRERSDKDGRGNGETNNETTTSTPKATSQRPGGITGEVRALSKRAITEATCQKWGYRVGRLGDRPVHIANYYRAGSIVAQKIRFPDKTFTILGPDTQQLPLFGQHLWRDAGKMIVVTEGEIDAMSVSQVQDNKWPVVSVPNGAQGAAKSIARATPWLENFEKVIFMFDMDEPGQEAARECAALLTPGKAFIANLPLHDANDMLVAKRGKEIVDAIWGAKVFRPDGIRDVDSLKEEVRTPPSVGMPWPWDVLTQATYGRRRGELYALGAGVGTGKTELFKEIMHHIVTEDHLPVGGLFLEESAAHTLRALASKFANKRFHVPTEDGKWDLNELDEALDAMGDKVFLFDHFGAKDFKTISERIRYMVQGLGIKDIFLDHMTALTASAHDERRSLDKIMAEMASLAHNLDFSLYFISHLTTPDGKSHEEGGRVLEKHFTGSRAIARWSHFMFGLERDKQDINGVTTLRVLKDRFTGDAHGLTFGLRYDRETGRLIQCDIPKAASGFDVDDDY